MSEPTMSVGVLTRSTCTCATFVRPFSRLEILVNTTLEPVRALTIHPDLRLSRRQRISVRLAIWVLERHLRRMSSNIDRHQHARAVDDERHRRAREHAALVRAATHVPLR